MYSQEYSVFCEYHKIKAETKKKCKGQKFGPLSPLKVFTLKMATHCILYTVYLVIKAETEKVLRVKIT